MSLQLLPMVSGALVLPAVGTAVQESGCERGNGCVGAALPMRVARGRRILRLSDPATRLMTDFTHERALTIEADRDIDGALDNMFRLGVAALLVMRADTVAGLITSHDIHRERARQVARSWERKNHDEIRVGHLMTRTEDFAALDWPAICGACARDVLQLFRSIWASHLIILEEIADGRAIARGLLSRTRLERQLGQGH